MGRLPPQPAIASRSVGPMMSSFYRLHGGRDKPSIAAALRQAQLSMIDNKVDGKDFRHPFFWGPFVLMGDWR
jgi:CHAT domain-containing protein